MRLLASIIAWIISIFNRTRSQKTNVPNSHTIKKGETPSPVDSKPILLDRFEIKDVENGTLDLWAFLKNTETDGLIVLHNGQIIFEYYDQARTDRSKHRVMSITKSIIGLVAGVLVKQGKLDVNKLVSEYVPEMIGTAFDDVTVRQCLDMRSGLQFDNADLEYRKASGLIPLKDKEDSTDLHKFLSTFQAPSASSIDGLEGPAFDYLSINADLVGWVLERASGHKLADLISDTVWQPMGAESDALIITDRGGNARASGGMCATLRDIARLGQLIVDDNSGIIPVGWIHDMVRNGSKEAFDAGSWQKELKRTFKTIAYRSYWLVDFDSETLISLGIFGQLMIVDRVNGILMVKFSSQPSRLDARKKNLAIAAFREFQRILIELGG